MTQRPKNRRGTAIVETEQGILVLIEGSKRQVLLPGGQAERGESRLRAAVRELEEETGLIAYLVLPLFRYSGSFSEHTVYYVKAKGQPELKHDITYLGYFQDGKLTKVNCQPEYESISEASLSRSARKIIERYLKHKDQHEAFFAGIEAYSRLALDI